MFTWFKRHREEKEAEREEVHRLVETFLGPLALATALESVSIEYMQSLAAAGRLEPSYKRIEADGLIGVWNNTRFEFYATMLAHGADLKLLSDVGMQADLFRLFVDEKVHLRIPIGEAMTAVSAPETSLMAIMHGYLLLSRVGADW